ncbi:hypothetical protein EI94DRAFT_1707135 [Lactarius quietus]|nr:hypothetical protein EI94DRAFT_1707135 [Lactarius quietus]
MIHHPVTVLLVLAYGILPEMPPEPHWGGVLMKHTWSTLPEHWEALSYLPVSTMIDLHIELTPQCPNALADALYEISYRIATPSEGGLQVIILLTSWRTWARTAASSLMSSWSHDSQVAVGLPPLLWILPYARPKTAQNCHDYPEAHTWESRAEEDIEEEAVRVPVAAEDDSYLAYDEACKVRQLVSNMFTRAEVPEAGRKVTTGRMKTT